MPHVVLNGDVQLRDVFQRLRPLVLRDPQTLIRTNKKYLDSEGTAIIIESLAGQPNRLHQFLTVVNARKDGLVIRIHPYSQVEKTSQVKQLLAEIAKQLLVALPDLRLGKTNLQEFMTQESNALLKN